MTHHTPTNYRGRKNELITLVLLYQSCPEESISITYIENNQIFRIKHIQT